MKTHRCARCGEEKPVSSFYKQKDKKSGLHSWCKDCIRARNKERYASDPEYRRKVIERASAPKARARQRTRKRSPEGRRKAKDYELRTKFGITVEDFEVMLSEQGGRCAVCGTDSPGGQGNQFHVDHCHRTGKVRALLCSNCNRGLGHFQESEDLLLKAIQYLRQHTAQDAC